MLLSRLMGAGLPGPLAQAFCDDIADNQVATGTTQATALSAGTGIVRCTTVDSGTGVRLANQNRGDSQIIINAGANTLNVYPPVGQTINALSANAAFTVESGSWACFDRITNLKWLGQANNAANAADVSFTPEGSGAVSEAVQAALRHYVHTEQYATTPDFTTARNALTGTFGVKDYSFTHANNSVTGALINETINGADSVAQTPFWMRSRYLGTITSAASGAGGNISPFKVLFTDQCISEVEPIQAATILDLCVGNSSTTTTELDRRALTVDMRVTGAYGDLTTTTPFIGEQINSWADATQGGTGGWSAPATPVMPYFRGAMQGLNVLTYLKSGGTNYLQVVAAEIAFALQAGSSARDAFALHLSKKDTSAVDPVLDEGLLLLAVQSGATGIKSGIAFGRTVGEGNWPVRSTGTMIGIIPQVYPTAKTRADRTAAYGVDLREATFSGSAFASNGFSVNDSGVVALTSDLFTSISDPAAPAASTAVLYARTNGGGKMELAVRFPTGVVQVIATEP